MYLKLLVAIVIIAGVAVGGVFIKDYLDQTAAADTLQTQIANSSKTASNMAAQTRELQDELADISRRSAEAEIAVNAGRQSMPERTNSNTAVRDILSAGEQFGVTVIPLSTQEWVGQKVDKHEYSVFRVRVDVSGPPDNTVAFIKHLQDQLYPTLVIESLDLTKTIQTIEGEGFLAPAGENPPTGEEQQLIEPPAAQTLLSADLKLAIYAK